MVGEVIPNEGIEAVVVRIQVRRHDGHELALPSRRRPGASPVEQGRGPVAAIGPVGRNGLAVPVGAVGRVEQERGRHQQRRRGLVLGPLQDLGRSARVIADQPAEEKLVIRHEGTIAAGADDALMVG